MVLVSINNKTHSQQHACGDVFVRFPPFGHSYGLKSGVWPFWLTGSASSRTELKTLFVMFRTLGIAAVWWRMYKSLVRALFAFVCCLALISRYGSSLITKLASISIHSFQKETSGWKTAATMLTVRTLRQILTVYINALYSSCLLWQFI